MAQNLFRRISAFTAIGLLMAIGCQKPATERSQSELKAIVDQLTTTHTDVLLSGNLDSVIAYYDKDAALSPDGFPIVQGKENIRTFLARGMKMAKFSKLEFNTEYVDGNGNYIYQMGLMNSEIIVYDSLHYDNSAKFFYLWKLQSDGTYKIAAEVTNTKDEDVD